MKIFFRNLVLVCFTLCSLFLPRYCNQRFDQSEYNGENINDNYELQAKSISLIKYLVKNKKKKDFLYKIYKGNRNLYEYGDISNSYASWNSIPITVNSSMKKRIAMRILFYDFGFYQLKPIHFSDLIVYIDEKDICIGGEIKWR
jgi:hypothetical protein